MTRLARTPEDDHGMLSSIRLRNFKCYRDSRVVELAPLTVFLGCNNSGKSTVIQALQALKYTLADRSTTVRFLTTAPFLTLGGFFDFRHSGAQDKDGVTISLERDPKSQSVPETLPFHFRESTGLSLTLSASKETNNIEVARVALSDAKGKAFLEANESGEWSYDGLSAAYRQFLGVRLMNFLPDVVPLQPKRRPRKSSIKPNLLFEALMSMEMHSRLWTRLIVDIRHIAPLRAHVPWYTSSTGRASSLFGDGGENLIHDLASNEHVRDGKTLLELVNEWISANMKLIGNLRIKHVDRDRLVWSLLADDPEGHRGINVAAMGEGISQSLPIIAAALSLDRGACLTVEQPEIHLHPAAQADLGDLFVDVAQDGTRQVIVETHSEHMLLRIRRRVAEKKIDPTKVSILFVERKSGESTVRRLNLNDRGHFEAETPWPRGFFSTAYEESTALTVAQRPVNEK